MTPEGEIKREIDKALAECGKSIWWFKPVQFGYGDRALDYVGWVNGKPFAVEAKRPGKKPTKFQQITIEKMRSAGGTVFVCADTHDVYRFEQWLSTT